MRKVVIAAAAIGVPAMIAAYVAIQRAGPVGNRSVPEPAKPVDLQRYLGRWYEQFRYEASFQRGMDAVTADYALNGDGTIRVVNRGRQGGINGKEKSSTGKAKVVDTARNAKLKVSFFGPFQGDYWVLDHGDRYDWSIVGEPSGRYLWALTRARHPDASVIAMLETRARELGYDLSLVRRTEQP
ncbi:lipocalin family protein [Sphingomonas sp. CCH5-D11]|uniref:lipocalin family protein n=1 Tax=Sphingomonas sp. CCH5-D11 TaxID=1768786 RepID=UPI000829C136|nr:lipocalin family protein [Sphingomonas sp. CCH5-D11]